MIQDSLAASAFRRKITHRLSLRANFSWIFLGRTVYAASQWGILVVLARLGTPEIVGRFGLALAITAPVFALLNLNLRTLLATDARREYTFDTYLGLRLTAIAISVLAILAFILGVGYLKEVSAVILALVLAKAIESVSDLLFGLIQKHERLDYIAKSAMLKGPLSLLCLGGLFFLTGSLLWAVLGLATVWAGVLLLYDVSNTRRLLQDDERFRPSFRISQLSKLAWLAAPLGVTTVLISINSSVPRYLIEHHHGEALLGIFAAMVYITVAGDIVFAALRQAATPRLSKYFGNNRQAFMKLLAKLVGVGIVLGMGGVLLSLLVGEELLTLIYGPSYGAYADVFVWIMIGGMAMYIVGFLFIAMIAMRLLRAQVLISAASTSVGLAGAWLLIPDFGLMGAAWSMLIAACLNLLLGSGVVVHNLASQ